MPAIDWGYEGGRGVGPGMAGRPKPTDPFVIAVGVPAVPLFYPDQARRELNDLALDNLRLALQSIAGHVSDAAAEYSDTGNLAQSFGADPATPTGGIEMIGVDLLTGVSGRVFSSLPYAIVVDEGRRAGAPISRAGIDAIGLWAQRKLGLSAKEADSAKFAIANVIMTQGLEGRHFAERGFNAAKPGVEAMFANLGNLIGVALTGQEGGAA